MVIWLSRDDLKLVNVFNFPILFSGGSIVVANVGQFVRTRPRLTAVVAWYLLMNVVFIAMHAGLISVPGFEFVGSDARVVINAGLVARQQGEVFPLLPWEQINPASPLSNARYDVSVHVLFSLFSPGALPRHMIAIQLWIVGGLLAYIWIIFKIVLLIDEGAERELRDYLWLFVGASSLMLNLSYLNIEVWVAVAALYIVYTMLKDDLSVGAIMAMAFIMVTKPQFAMLVFGLAFALKRPLFGLYYAVNGSGALIFVLVMISLLFGLDINYLMGQVMSRVEFLAATPDLFPWHLYQEIPPNSLALVALRYFGPTQVGVRVWEVLVLLAILLILIPTWLRLRSKFDVQNHKLNALAVALTWWSGSQLLLWQVEYNSFAPLVYMLVMMFGAPSMKRLVRLLLPYLLFQFIDLVLMAVGVQFSIIRDTPLVVFSLFVQLAALLLPLRINRVK